MLLRLIRSVLIAAPTMTFVIDHQVNCFSQENIALRWSHVKEDLSVYPVEGAGNNAACNPCSLSWNISRTAALILCLSVGLEVCFPCQLHLETSVGIQNLQLQLRPTASETMGMGPST